MTDKARVELLHGTLDLIVLRALATMGPLHAYALASRLDQVAEHPLMLNQGTLYPALVRLEQRGWIKGAWRQTESRRVASVESLRWEVKQAEARGEATISRLERQLGQVERRLAALTQQRRLTATSSRRHETARVANTPRRGADQLRWPFSPNWSSRV